MESFLNVVENYLNAPSAEGLSAVERSILEQRKMQNQPRIYKWFLQAVVKTFSGAERPSQVQLAAIFQVTKLALPFYVFSVKNVSDYVNLDYSQLLNMMAREYVSQRDMAEKDRETYFQQLVKALFLSADTHIINVDLEEAAASCTLVSAIFRIVDVVERETRTLADKESLQMSLQQKCKLICGDVVYRLLDADKAAADATPDLFCIRKLGERGAMDLLQQLLKHEGLDERPASTAVLDVDRRLQPVFSQLGRTFTELLADKNMLESELDFVVRQYYQMQQTMYLDAGMHILRVLGSCPIGQLRKDALRRLVEYSDFETEIMLLSAGCGIAIDCLLSEIKSLSRNDAKTLTILQLDQKQLAVNSGILEELLGTSIPANSCIDLGESVAAVRISVDMDIFLLKMSLELLLVYKYCFQLKAISDDDFSFADDQINVQNKILQVVGKQRFLAGVQTLRSKYFLIDMEEGRPEPNQGFVEVYSELRSQVLRIDEALMTAGHRKKEQLNQETLTLIEKAELMQTIKRAQFVPAEQLKLRYQSKLIEELLEADEIFLDEHGTVHWDE